MVNFKAKNSIKLVIAMSCKSYLKTDTAVAETTQGTQMASIIVKVTQVEKTI